MNHWHPTLRLDCLTVHRNVMSIEMGLDLQRDYHQMEFKLKKQILLDTRIWNDPSLVFRSLTMKNLRNHAPIMSLKVNSCPHVTDETGAPIITYQQTLTSILNSPKAQSLTENHSQTGLSWPAQPLCRSVAQTSRDAKWTRRLSWRSRL